MKRVISLLAVVAGMTWSAFAASGNCEGNAVSISFSASGGYRTVQLVPAYDPEDKTSDPNQGVYYFKATLKRSIAYSVWTTGIGTNDTVQVSIYPEEPPESSSKDAPSADFTEVDEPNNDQRYILYADDWYIDPDDPSASDPTSWTYLIEVTGDVGESVTVNFQQGVVIPQGRPEAPLTISPSTTPARITRKLQLDDEYYLRARLVAGRLYWFGTSGGTPENVLSVDIAKATADDDEDEDTFTLFVDPDYETDENNFGVYVLPSETAYYTILVSGGEPKEDEAAAAGGESGATFVLGTRQFAEQAIGAHASIPLDAANGFTAQGTAGAVVSASNFAAGVYDEVIDTTLFSFAAMAGQRYLAETAEAATNLLLRVYDSRGNMLAENTGDGVSFNARAGFTATTAGVYYIGVCQNLADFVNEVPANTSVRVSVAPVESVPGQPDAWDAADDEPAGATPLSPVTGTGADDPAALDPAGHGWHRLDRGDWCDVFQIAGRRGVTYALRASLADASAAHNSLRAEVFTLAGTLERSVETAGGLAPDAAWPLQFTATANAVYYVRVSVAEGAGLDYPAYKVHASAFAADGAALGSLTVNTHGTPAGFFTLDRETVKYAGGSTVAVSGAPTVVFGAVAGFATPAAQTVTVAAGPTPTVVDVYYSDTFDPKDDRAATATAWALKATETSFARTLWPTDPADNFSFAAVDGYFYDFDLRDVTGDAVFAITNAQLGTIVKDVTHVEKLALPKTLAKYVLTVSHGTAAKAGGAYTLAGSFANVGALKLAKTVLNAKENAPSVALAVSRTAKAGRVRVKYATVAGTAKPGVDYVHQEGVLEWPDNDSKARTVTVRLIPDLVAVWEENKTFTIAFEPLPEEALSAGEYRASFVGGADACTVTLTEVSRAGTTVESTYAAKAPKGATVATENVPLETGTFTGLLTAEEGMLTNGLPALASVTLTASTATPAALSAKVLLAGKTYTFAGRGWDAADASGCAKTFELVQKVNNVAYTNRLSVSVAAGRTTDPDAWLGAGGTMALEMNVPDANGKGVQQQVCYAGVLRRQNAKIQDYLNVVTNFTGYYTVSLKPQGVTAADGVPAGSGYLTLTVDNKGTVKVAGLLADGVTKPSLSVPAAALVPSAASANGYVLEVPVFFAKAPTLFGGVLSLTAQEKAKLPSGKPWQVVVDAASPLVWNNDNPAATYAGTAGFGLALAPCGGWYDTVFNLQTYYKSASLEVDTVGLAAFPREPLMAGYDYATAVEPDGTTVSLAGDALATEKKVIAKNGTVIDLAGSVNICNVQTRFTRATGLYTGSCSLWSANAAGALKEVTGLKHFGVVVLAKDDLAPLPVSTVGAGFLTQAVKVPTLNPVTGRTTQRAWTFSAPFNLVLSAGPTHFDPASH